MADPGSNLSRKDETVRGAIEGVKGIPNRIMQGVRRVGRAVNEVVDGAVSLVNNPPENPGAFSKAPPYEESAEGVSPIERVDEYEKKHPFASYALSKMDKNFILQKDNGIISSQLDMRSLNTVRIFTGIEVYNLSVRLDTDTSMYNSTPIRDKEEEVFINSSPEAVKKAPEIIMTLTDFNNKYLKWMDEVDDGSVKQRKRDLKNLFKFVFNNSKLNDLSTSFVKKLQRIAHTPLDTEDKLPCQGSQLYEDFKRSLEYRMAEAVKEMEVALATFGEMNSYTQQKIILYDGIYDLVRLMNGGYSRGCIKYQYGNKSDYRVVMDLAEQNRIMRLFIQFIQKKEPGYMNSATLQQSLKDKEKFVGIPSDGSTETFNALYNQLTEILESMRTPSSSEEIESLKGQLKEKELAILALESLLQISIQITHLNEGYLELEERYQRVETKMESEKLFQQYEKFRGLLGGLRLNASMQGLIDCGEKLSGIMIQYSLRKDISEAERAEATERLIEVDRVLSRYNKNMDIYPGLRGLYEDVRRMIEKKYRASASGLPPLAPVAPPSAPPAPSAPVAPPAPVAAAPVAPPAPAVAPVAVATHAHKGVKWANAKGDPLSTNQPNPGVQVGGSGSSSGSGKPTPQQKLQAIFDIESNSDTKTYCDTVLTLLLIDMKRKMYDFDAKKFMKKLGTSLDKTKSCPVVFHILKIILDEGMKQVIDSNAYIFSPQKPFDYTEDTFKNLEQTYTETFDDSEKEAFENMTPIRYYHRTPEQFRDLLGDSPYILSGHSEEAEPELRGVDVDGVLYDEPLRMTADEKNLLTCGGIPMGAIIFMYITAVANNTHSDLLKSLQSEPLLE